jgi:hypothetical protein
MRTLPFVVLALALQAPAKADKFWLSDPAAKQQATEGSSPAMIEGVLIAESDEGYHVRIVGGEVLLPKKAVFRIEKDGLSVEAIVQQELALAKAQAAAPAAAEAAPATATKRSGRRQAKAAEAAARKASEPATPAPAAVEPPAYDPVLHRATPAPGTTTHAELMAEAQLAWTLTRDRRYMTLLRRLRRLH